MKKGLILKNILYLIQGALVGVGAILPGVSGGVLCVVFGIYEPMMELLTHPFSAIKKHYKMFIPFTVGWLLGFVLLAKAIELLFAASAPIALMLFFGLICGTLPSLFKSAESRESDKSWTPLILSLALAYLLFHLLENGSQAVIAPSFGGFLICGFFWGLSLIVPGLSSSSILICLGLFEPMTAGLVSMDPAVVLPMLIGIAATALLFARVVHILYHKHFAVTSRIILGFVIASALKILPSSFGTPFTLCLSLACFAIGFALASMMERIQI